jgi:ABC-type molybdate transport system substrate-binding protein
VEKPRVFAETDLVLAIPADKDTVLGVPDLAKPGIRISTQAPGTPAGELTRLVIGRLPLPRPERRAVAANLRNSRHNVADLKHHLADAAFVYAPEVQGVRKINFGNASKPAIAYEIAVVKGTPRVQAARAFVAGLRTRASRALLRRAGLRPR